MLFNSFQIILLQDILNDLEINEYFIGEKVMDNKDIKQEILNNFIKYYKSIPVDLQTDRYFDSILYHYKNIYLHLCFV